MVPDIVRQVDLSRARQVAQPLVELEPDVPRETISALAIDPGEDVLLIYSRVGSKGDAGGTLRIVDTKTGAVQFTTWLSLGNVSALAFHPLSKQLHALEAPHDSDALGGLFRLEIKAEGGEPSFEATPLVTLERPRAMSFDRTGLLYVTLGSSAHDGEKAGGKLVRIGGLE